MSATHEIRLPIAEFDSQLLDTAARSLTGSALSKAIQSYFESRLIDSTGAAEILVTQTDIVLRWTDQKAFSGLTEEGIRHLSQGDYDRGITLLRIALQKDPKDQDALFNLGMALSDKGNLDESVDHLKNYLQLDPSSARGWTALGVALARSNRPEEAVEALRRAIHEAPDDPYAQKNLGALLIETAPEEAKAILGRAAKGMPEDAQVWLSLGKVNEKLGELSAADEAYLKVLEISPYGGIADLAKDGRSRLSEQNFRNKGSLRPDALMYCVSAIEIFKGLPPSEVQKITFEIATLGMNGLDVNDPEKKYRLTSLPGQFSGLQLLCTEYVGFKQVDPAIDLGFDLSNEYAAALKLA